MTRSSGSESSLSLTTGGITLLGVLISVGATVGFGISAEWWVRVLAGMATTVVLAVLVKLGTAEGRGPLASVVAWMIGRPDSDGDGSDA